MYVPHTYVGCINRLIESTIFDGANNNEWISFRLMDMQHLRLYSVSSYEEVVPLLETMY